MRKTVILLLSAAFVAALPAIASAKRLRHHHPRPAMTAVPVTENAGPRFVGNALYQILVPWEQTFGSRPVIEKKVRVRHAVRRRAKTS